MMISRRTRRHVTIPALVVYLTALWMSYHHLYWIAGSLVVPVIAVIFILGLADCPHRSIYDLPFHPISRP